MRITASRQSTLTWAEAQSTFAHPAFDSIRSSLSALSAFDPLMWPTLERLNQLAIGTSNYRHAPIRFINPDPDDAQLHYETRIAVHGLIATRENWHDLFNAIAWLGFPRAKAAISEMHARFISNHGEPELKHRSPERDVLTLFDEGGAVVFCDDEKLLDLVRGFHWKALFWERRAAVAKHMRIVIFGHSLFEKMLAPYVGITAKSILVPVPSGGLKELARLAEVDARLAETFLDPQNLASTSILAPLPILGWPGWCAETENESFYGIASYFRSGRALGRQGRKVQ